MNIFRDQIEDSSAKKLHVHSSYISKYNTVTQIMVCLFKVMPKGGVSLVHYISISSNTLNRTALDRIEKKKQVVVYRIPKSSVG